MIPSPETALKTAYSQPVTLVVVGALPRSYDCRPIPQACRDHVRINIEPFSRRTQSQSRFRGGGSIDSQMEGSWVETARDLREIWGGNEDMEIRLGADP